MGPALRHVASIALGRSDRSATQPGRRDSNLNSLPPGSTGGVRFGRPNICARSVAAGAAWRCNRSGL
jgi:hypothetical protein